MGRATRVSKKGQSPNRGPRVPKPPRPAPRPPSDGTRPAAAGTPGRRCGPQEPTCRLPSPRHGPRPPLTPCLRPAPGPRGRPLNGRTCRTPSLRRLRAAATNGSDGTCRQPISARTARGPAHLLRPLLHRGPARHQLGSPGLGGPLGLRGQGWSVAACPSNLGEAGPPCAEPLYFPVQAPLLDTHAPHFS